MHDSGCSVKQFNARRALVVLLSKHNQQAMVSLYKIQIMKCGTPIWTYSFREALRLI
jgi:hypothetical protein